MNRMPLVFTAALVFSFSACGPTMTVETSGAPPTPIAIGSYSWTTNAGGVAGNLQLARNAGVDERIREVMYTGYPFHRWSALERELAVDEVNDLFRYRGRLWTVSNVEVREFERGTLILDLTDPESGEPLWRGAAEAELHSEDRDYRERRLREAVQAILTELPTGSDR